MSRLETCEVSLGRIADRVREPLLKDGITLPPGRLPERTADDVLAPGARELEGAPVDFQENAVGREHPEELERVLEDGAQVRFALAHGIVRRSALGHLDASADDVLDRAIVTEDGVVAPRDEMPAPVLRDPVLLALIRELAGTESCESCFDGVGLLRGEKEIPGAPALHLFAGKAGHPLTSVVEPDDAPLAIDYDDERSHLPEDRLAEIRAARDERLAGSRLAGTSSS